MRERFTSDHASEKDLNNSFLCCFKSKKSKDDAENRKAFDDPESSEEENDNLENEAFFVTQDNNSNPPNEQALLKRANIFQPSITNLSNGFPNSVTHNNATINNKPSGFQKLARYVKIYKKRYKCFVNSPKVHFIFDAVFFTIFLIMFSYLILCKFTFYKTSAQKSGKMAFEEEIDPTNNRSIIENELNSTHVFLSRYKQNSEQVEISEISKLEYALLFWVVSLLIEEVRQVSFFL